MKKFKLWRLKNEMMAVNILANIIAVGFYKNGMLRPDSEPSNAIWQNPFLEILDIIFTPGAFIFIIIVTYMYERPIRAFLDAKFSHEQVLKEVKDKARQRLLNEPFVLIGLDLSMWLLSGGLDAIISWMSDIGSVWVLRTLLESSGTGLVTAALAFFLLEYVLQNRLASHFFPEGGLYKIPKTVRIRIRTRMVALLFVCNLIPFFSIMHTFYRISITYDDPSTALEILNSSVFTSLFIFAGVSIILTVLVSRNLTFRVGKLIQILRSVRKGEFDKRVKVTSNDEIGYTGDVVNEMTKGLIERERMQQSLNLAKEVQQNLLPKSNLKVNGFDIAGKSVYCDETGGDYYDFISIGENDKKKIGVAIGDVSGHGISSALLMATVRSSLRQRASLPGSIAKIISDVNRLLVQDVEDSGQFMTMFFLALNTKTRHIEWVRAGHEPGIVYDPGSDSFSELGGLGIALGVDAKWIYEDNKVTNLSKGQIIFLSTDGAWEVRNKKGEMLGKEPILNAIRQKSSSDATQIIDAIFDVLDKFIGESKVEDDITSVIIKIKG